MATNAVQATVKRTGTFGSERVRRAFRRDRRDREEREEVGRVRAKSPGRGFGTRPVTVTS